MTENEAIKKIREQICNETGGQRYCRDNCMHGIEHCAYSMAIQALEEIPRYRDLGTVDELAEMQVQYYHLSHQVKEFEKIGTIEECRTAVERMKPKKVLFRKQHYGTPWLCPECETDQIKCEFFSEDGSEPQEKHTYCWSCGTVIDWSE